VGYKYMTHIFVVKSTSQETNGARKNRLDGRQKWLEPTWNVQVDFPSRLPAWKSSLYLCSLVL